MICHKTVNPLFLDFQLFEINIYKKCPCVFRVVGTFMDIKTALRTTPYISKTFLLPAQPRLLIDRLWLLIVYQQNINVF